MPAEHTCLKPYRGATRDDGFEHNACRMLTSLTARCGRDLIATHPPYASIIPYSHDREDDLSSVHNIAEFADEMRRMLVHEHLYVFRKPDAGERTTRFKESMKWWYE